MHTTTLGEALKGAGIDPKKDQVRNLAADALRKFNTATKARERFISVIKQKRLTDTALEILFSHLADVIGKANGGVHHLPEGHLTHGAVDKSPQGAGAVRGQEESQAGIGGTQSSTGDGVLHPHDSQQHVGSSPTGIGVVQSDFESRSHHGRADLSNPPPGLYRDERGRLRRNPNKPHITPAVLQDVRDNTASIFQTFKLPNGVEIGRVKLGAIPGLINQFNGAIIANRVAIRVLQFVKDHVQPAHWGCTVEEVIRPDDLAKVISDAEEVCRHAA